MFHPSIGGRGEGRSEGEAGGQRGTKKARSKVVLEAIARVPVDMAPVIARYLGQLNGEAAEAVSMDEWRHQQALPLPRHGG